MWVWVRVNLNSVAEHQNLLLKVLYSFRFSFRLWEVCDQEMVGWDFGKAVCFWTTWCLHATSISWNVKDKLNQLILLYRLLYSHLNWKLYRILIRFLLRFLYRILIRFLLRFLYRILFRFLLRFLWSSNLFSNIGPRHNLDHFKVNPNNGVLFPGPTWVWELGGPATQHQLARHRHLLPARRAESARPARDGAEAEQQQVRRGGGQDPSVSAAPPHAALRRAESGGVWHGRPGRWSDVVPQPFKVKLCFFTSKFAFWGHLA